VNSNPLLISAQKQMLLVEEVRKKKKEITVGEEVPEWQSVSLLYLAFRIRIISPDPAQLPLYKMKSHSSLVF
jgi:hypothetical protein